MSVRTTATVKLCAVEGCERPRHAGGLCGSHYHRFVRHGDPLGGRQPDKQCAVPGWDRPHRSSGLCQFHYTRQRTGLALDAPRTHEHRTHRQARRALCRRLLDLGIVDDEDGAARFVATLATNWPAVACDITGLDTVDLLDLHGGPGF